MKQAISAGQTAKRMADTKSLTSLVTRYLPYTLIGLVFSLGSIFGLGVSHMIERMRVGAVAKDQKQILAEHYRDQIAAELGIDPKKVNHKHLDEAARKNPAFASIVRGVKLEQERGDRAAMMGTGAALALSGGVPILSGVTDAVGKVGGHMVGHVGGSMASGLFNKDKLSVEDVALHIDTKIEQGMPVDPTEVMLLRIAQDVNLQRQIDERFKKPMHKMNEIEQKAILSLMPDLYQAATHDAQMVNSGKLKSRDLVMVSPGAQLANAPQQSWTQRVGPSQTAAQSGDFRSRLAAQRAAAPAAVQGRRV